MSPQKCFALALALNLTLALAVAPPTRADDATPADASSQIGAQLSLTHDSVTRFLEEIRKSQAPYGDAPSADYAALAPLLPKKTAAALAAFEAELKQPETGILARIEPLMATFNATYASNLYSDDVKAQLLETQRTVLEGAARELSKIYQAALLRLADAPGIQVEKVLGQVQRITQDGGYTPLTLASTCKQRADLDRELEEDLAPDLRRIYQETRNDLPKDLRSFSNGEGEEVESGAPGYLGMMPYSYPELRHGCFSQLCVSQMTMDEATYVSLVSSLLNRPIPLTLKNGFVVTLQPSSQLGPDSACLFREALNLYPDDFRHLPGTISSSELPAARKAKSDEVVWLNAVHDRLETQFALKLKPLTIPEALDPKTGSLSFYVRWLCTFPSEASPDLASQLKGCPTSMVGIGDASYYWKPICAIEREYKPDLSCE